MVSNLTDDHVIPALVSVTPHITSAFVCTNDEQSIHEGTHPAHIKSFFKIVNITADVVQIPWNSESENRQKCLETAQRQLVHRVCDYWLSLTDSQVLLDDGSISLSELELDQKAYWIREVSHNSEFSRAHLIQSGHSWRYSDALQEFVLADYNATAFDMAVGNLPPSIYVVRKGTQRRLLMVDAILLEKLAIKQPRNPRIAFYLANV